MTNKLTNTSFNESRSFGIEIEFFGVHYNTVVNAMNDAGISVAYEGYNHTTRRQWKLVTDVSVTSTNTGLGRGLELVSPPLVGQAGLNEVRKVLDTLNSIGASVDKTCGMHVHHDASDLTVDHFKNLYGTYYKFENYIDMMMAPSRRGSVNGYCKSIDAPTMSRVLEAGSINELGSVLRDRYIKLNLCSYFRHGTIEFRQHGGSTDADKAVNWIVFTQMVVERSKGSKVRVNIEERGTDLNKLERQFRRNMLGNYTAGCLDNDYGQAFKFQAARRSHFESRIA